MIIAKNRLKVIKNIKLRVSKKQFNQKVEPNDPILSKEASNALIQHFWLSKQKVASRFSTKIIRGLFSLITPMLTSDLEIKGLENLITASSAFITCNHYNQLDILPIKKLAMKCHHHLYFLVKDTNLVMPFPINWIVRNADTIPINHDLHYLGRILPQKLETILKKQTWILVYPEQELWFNYRKPRPLQKGAYYYAAKLQKPIISCFVEIQDRRHYEWFHRDFHKTKRILHILPMIYPDPTKSISENTKMMREQDYLQKRQCYERVYAKKLNYQFDNHDIAGLDCEKSAQKNER